MNLLTPLQQEVLALLAPLSPPWTLTGGAALAGFHLGHRTTRDLDLFWHGTRVLGDEAMDVERLLANAGLEVAALQRSESFVRLQAVRQGESVVVDLVAEPVPYVDAPQPARLGNATILVDTPQEILTNKLGALLHRREPRDLVDIQALLRIGGDLARALAGAAQKDGGFSPLTLSWALEGFDVLTRARALGLPEAAARDLEVFRVQLRDEVARLAKP